MSRKGDSAKDQNLDRRPKKLVSTKAVSGRRERKVTFYSRGKEGSRDHRGERGGTGLGPGGPASKRGGAEKKGYREREGELNR